MELKVQSTPAGDIEEEGPLPCCWRPSMWIGIDKAFLSRPGRRRETRLPDGIKLTSEVRVANEGGYDHRGALASRELLIR